MPSSSTAPEPHGYRRKRGGTKIFTGVCGAFVLIAMAKYVLPPLGATLSLFGAAAIILQFGYAITGVYELTTGRPWQRLEDKWNALTPEGRGFWGTVIVTTICLIIGVTLWPIAPILRSLDPPEKPVSTHRAE